MQNKNKIYRNKEQNKMTYKAAKYVFTYQIILAITVWTGGESEQKINHSKKFEINMLKNK